MRYVSATEAKQALAAVLDAAQPSSSGASSAKSR